MPPVETVSTARARKPSPFTAIGVEAAMRACAREEIDVRIPFEDLPKADQDFTFIGSANLGVSSFALDDDGNEANALRRSRSFTARFQDTVTISEAKPFYLLADSPDGSPLRIRRTRARDHRPRCVRGRPAGGHGGRVE